MTPAQAAKQGGKRYRYYVCIGAQKRGWRTCPSKSLSAAAIETLVIEQLRGFAADPAAWNRAVGSTLDQHRALLAEKEAEARRLERELASLRAAYRKASPAHRVGACRSPSAGQGTVGGVTEGNQPACATPLGATPTASSAWPP